MPAATSSRHPFLGGPHPRATAHRGWHAGDLAGLENTLRAFTRAVSEGYSYVETDARVTADGAVVLHHDPFLGRTTGANALISNPVTVRYQVLCRRHHRLGQARTGGSAVRTATPAVRTSEVTTSEVTTR